jgi:hypothetical protein
MKKSSKTSTAVWILIIVILLIMVGGMYIYSNKTTTTTTTPSTTTSTPSLIVPTMQEYTDADFGFSFWYPNGWQVTTVTNPPFGAQIQNGTIVRKLSVGNASDTWAIVIEEVNSPTMTITDTGGAGPFGPVTYFFNTPQSTWMKVTGEESAGVPVATTTADVSVDTMGGLPMFSGTSRFDTTIVPLNTQNFLVVSDGGTVNATALAKTITPTNPSVIPSAVAPVSEAEQTQIIQAEESAFAIVSTDSKPSSVVPVATALQPTGGRVGSMVTLNGTGFLSTNTVLFGGGPINSISSTNGGTTLTFTVPSSVGADCQQGKACPMYERLITAGIYSVTVRNTNGTSNAVSFTVNPQ